MSATDDRVQLAADLRDPRKGLKIPVGFVHVAPAGAAVWTVVTAFDRIDGWYPAVHVGGCIGGFLPEYAVTATDGQKEQSDVEFSHGDSMNRNRGGV